MSAKAAKPVAQSPTSTPAAKDVASLQVSLPQMLDLALGTPEIGAVNLNILHNFLHIVLHQINLRTTKVEYRGDDANRIKTMVTSLNPGPSLYLQEYTIIDGSGDVKHRVDTTDAISVDVVTDDTENLAEESSETSVKMKKTKGTKQQIGAGAEGAQETVIYIEPVIDGVAPTALGFKRLEETVNKLQQRFQALTELTTNPELIERLKGKMTDPLTDVWQIINITKRLDASEQGIDKLTTMVQDAIKGGTDVPVEEPSQLEDRLKNLETALNNLDQTVRNLQVIASIDGEEEETVADGETQQPSQRISLTQLLGGINVAEIHKDVETLQAEVSTIRGELDNLKGQTGAETPATQRSAVQQEEKTEPVKQEAQKAEVLEDAKKAEDTETAASKETVASAAPQKPAEVPTPEDATQKKRAAVESEEMDSDTLTYINERLTKLEKDVACLNEKVDSAPPAGTTGSAELDDLVSKIHGIQTDMEKLNQTADHLIDDRENREVHLNALLEQVELLKTIKADREDLEDALADKADAQAINRKVSYDQFDAACDDLAQGLEDAIGKLGKQESIWQQSLDEVQREIEGKVDKIEITPLKDFVHTRLKTLQEKLKNVAQMRQEAEAAGSKKMLRDVQCISCDKNVVMKMEDTNKFRVEPLPCSMSMKPYLTYELDQVRKQHRRLPHSRNMIQFEAAVQEESKRQKSARSDALVKTPRDHQVNRYCGGSHTVTTPQQRVMRMGHYLSQWGPEVVQLTEGMVKGTDGRMYRSRQMLGKFDDCEPAYCEGFAEEAPSSERPSPATPRRKSTDSLTSTVSKKRSSKKFSKGARKGVTEKIAETAAVETEDPVSDAIPLDLLVDEDRVVPYRNEEEMGEGD
ncbi:uncharacterized protein LOC143366725 isoform X2 [Andrena cerasifolii]|uniref:uncharacterized protein LOC143366725 isoform X2 n=1 Tax=Andrena cerasifolii TaxID=2819439 RepID=UPI004037CC10